MPDLLDVLEHLVKHARGYATIDERDAHLHVIAQAREGHDEAETGQDAHLTPGETKGGM